MSPPTLARLVAHVLAPRDVRAFVLQDLDDRFAAHLARSGARAARRWYWSQVLRGAVWTIRPDGELIRRRSWQGTAGDVRTSLRSLARRPLHTLGVAGTLALGLGAAAMVIAVTWGVWLSPMPWPDPDRVVRVFETEMPGMTQAAGQGPAEPRHWRISPPLLEDLRANQWTTVAAVAGVSQSELDWSQQDEVRRVQALVVSPELFSILGITPRVGRVFSEDDVHEVVLSSDFWERAFGGDPNAVTTASMTLDDSTYRVVGVVHLGGGYPGRADVLMPFAFAEGDLTEGMRGARYLDAIARVQPGHTVAEARAEVDAFVGALGEVHPQHRGWGGDIVSLSADLIRPFRATLALLLAAGATFLLLAVVNVAGLVAARRVETRQERAVRLALGASEGRLLRASMIESLLLGAAGAAAGLLAGTWLLPPLRALVPQDIPRLSDVGLGWTSGTLVIATGLAVGAMVGVLGYAMSRGAGPSVGRSPASAPAGLRGRRTLVIGQVALTTLLTAGGVAILRHASELRSIDVGFEAEGVLSAASVLSELRYPSDESRRDVWLALVDRMQARGIHAAVVTNPPMTGTNMPFGFRVDAASEQAFAQYHSVTAEYFDVMGIALAEGRLFGTGDHEASAPVVIVSEALAAEHFPGQTAVGREIRVVSEPRTIVGVVATTRHHGPDADVQLDMYVPLAQDPWVVGHVLLDTERDDAATVLAQVAQEIDPQWSLPPARPYGEYLDAWSAPLRLQLVMVGILAILGLTLASLGLYALVAYHVSSRRREIGIRMALGAPGTKLFQSVVRQGLVMALAGALVGFTAWYGLQRFLGGVMEGVDAGDPLVPLLVAGVVGVASLAATLAPAWRSTTVDPMVTLRAE